MSISLRIFSFLLVIACFNAVFYTIYKANGSKYTKYLDIGFHIYIIATPLLLGYVLSLLYYSQQQCNTIIKTMLKTSKFWFFGVLITSEYIFMVIYSTILLMTVDYGNESFDTFAQHWESTNYELMLSSIIFISYFLTMIEVLKHCFSVNNYSINNNDRKLYLFMQFPLKLFSFLVAILAIYQLGCMFGWSPSTSVFHSKCKAIKMDSV